VTNFAKYKAIERSTAIYVNNINIARASKGGNPITGGFQQVSAD